MRIFTTVVALYVILAVGMLSSSAQAAFQVTLSETGATSMTIVDNLAGDNDATVGIINIGSVMLAGGSYTFVGTLAFDNSSTATNFGFVMSDFSVSGSGEVGDMIGVYANSNGFTSPSTPPDLIGGVSGSANITMGSATATAALYIDDTAPISSTGPTGTLVASDTVTVTANPPNSDSDDFFDTSFIGGVSTPYALNLYVTATFATAGPNLLNLDATGGVANIPEPTTLAIWGLFGLTAVGGGAWRRRRAAQKS